MTNARGEVEQTTVIFDAKAMRTAMAPGLGAQSAEELMHLGVKAFKSPTSQPEKHFFEVRLEGFTDPPDECISAAELETFVSQVAPVPHSTDFSFREEILKEAREFGIRVLTVSD